MRIFVIILNWNRADDTIECLESCSRLENKNFDLKIVLVDNASSDDSFVRIKNEALKILKDKTKFKIIQNSKNLGFAGGNNVGLRFALDNGAEYVLVLNNDTIVHRNLLLGLIETTENYPTVGAISPKIYFAKGYEFHKERYEKRELGRVIWYAGGKIDWKNVYATNRGVDEVDRGQYDKITKTDFATGACMFLSAKALREVGLFDEKFFMYFEDVDLSCRMRKNGWEVLYSPYGYLWHKVSQSSKVGGSLADYYLTRNRLLFALRYAPKRTKFALLRESIRFLLGGRKWQRLGVLSFYLKNFGKGSYYEF